MGKDISEIIDLPALQKLMESLYEATGINHALIDNDSKVLTAVGWQKLCTDFHTWYSAMYRRSLNSKFFTDITIPDRQLYISHTGKRSRHLE